MKQNVSILMITWIHLKDSVRRNYQIKDDFYSILNVEHISDAQYVHAIKVWKTCN